MREKLGLALGGMVVGLALISGAIVAPGYGEDAQKPAKKEREKAKGYLPPFYRDVIDGVQREKIYQIQDQYEDKINALESELKAIKAKRDGEIEALLTTEQKARMAQLMQEAKTKRDADTKAKESAKPAAPKT